jgi:hypothetical protein
VIESVQEFYAYIEELIVELRAAHRATDADLVENTLRGSAIAGEIFGRLKVALVEIQPKTAEMAEAITFIDTFPLYP